MKDYHDNYDYLSKSFLTKFDTSPAHAYHYMMHRGEIDTPAMRFGRAYHSIIEGKFFARFAIFDETARPELDKTMASKANKEWKATFLQAAKENNMEVIGREEADQIGAMLERLKANEIVQMIKAFDLVQEEAFRAEIDGYKIKCKPDGLQLNRGKNGENLVIDWKTCASVHPMKVKYDIPKFGYDVQAAMYSEIISAMNDNRETNFMFIFQEKNEPYDVLPVVIRWGSNVMQEGSDKWRDYYIQARKCFDTGIWPGVANKYEGGVLILD